MQACPAGFPDYSLQFADFNAWSTVGAFVFGLSQLLFLILVQATRAGKTATTEVWEGSEGLEWTVPSPAPYHTFAEPPKVSSNGRFAAGAVRTGLWR